MIATRLRIFDALAAIFEDVSCQPDRTFHLEEEMTAVFEPDEMDHFRQQLEEEFEIEADDLYHECTSFREVIDYVEKKIS